MMGTMDVIVDRDVIDVRLHLQAVVLDFDGVVLDSESAEFEAHRRIFERYGATLTVEEWTSQIGIYSESQATRWHDRLRELSPMAPDLDSFQAERSKLFAQLLSNHPMPGIEALLDEVERAHVPVAIASTEPELWVVGATARDGIGARVRTIVSANDETRRKPAPDVYLEAVRRLSAEPSRSVAIEDSGPGIRSALAAGLKTIAIPHRLTHGHDLAGAHLRVSSATELTLDALETLVDRNA